MEVGSVGHAVAALSQLSVADLESHANTLEDDIRQHREALAMVRMLIRTKTPTKKAAKPKGSWKPKGGEAA